MNGDDKSMNWYREINTTGLHTHGLHTSPTAPGDDVETSILPMSPSAATAFQETFVYDLPANHMGGTFFYHGHHHGSSTNQAFTGMMGLLIVDDRDGEVPNYISAMPERLMVWNHVHLKALNSIQGYFIDSSDYDIIQQYPTTHDIDETFLVNGARNPLLSLVAGQWERWRIVFSSLEYGMFFTLDSASCEMQLLAKDGMYLPEAPRKVTRLPLYPAARADVAFRCDGSTRRVTLKAEIMDYNDDKGKKIISYPADFSGTILTLDVTPSTLQPADDIQSFEVFRPCYQATTLNAVADYVKPLEFSGLQINEQTYKVDSKNALGSLGVGKIVESVVHGIIVRIFLNLMIKNLKKNI
jgi:FtsP/CotA-like multicopper oxidase with cupredoxin domain